MILLYLAFAWLLGGVVLIQSGCITLEYYCKHDNNRRVRLFMQLCRDWVSRGDKGTCRRICCHPSVCWDMWELKAPYVCIGLYECNECKKNTDRNNFHIYNMGHHTGKIQIKLLKSSRQIKQIIISNG